MRKPKIQRRRTTSHTARAGMRVKLAVAKINAGELSEEGRAYFAGVLEHLPEACKPPPNLSVSGLVEALMHTAADAAGIEQGPPIPDKAPPVPRVHKGGIFTW